MKANKKTTIHSLPDSYTAYNTLFFCSNTFINLNQIINDNGFFPLLIGKGEFPRIWLYMKNNNNEPIALVRDNISSLSQVKVNFYQIEKRISVEIFSMNDYIKILDIRLTNNTPNITNLDLRPIGYKIYGDSNSLNIGEGKYVNNVFQGMDTLIKIEKNKMK